MNGAAVLKGVVGCGDGAVRLGGFIGGGLVLLRPGRTIGIFLRRARKWEQRAECTKAKGGAQGCVRHWGLRCTFRQGSGRRNGRKFAIGPNSAIFEEFLFPDGDGFLEGVDGVAAGFECSFAMRRADSDEDAGFAYFQATEAMRDGD